MKLHIVVAISLLCFVFCDDEERKLSVTLNPGCEEQIGIRCEDLTFVHVEAEARNNTLHYLWDFTGIPSFFLAKTDKNVTLDIAWDDFMSGTGNTVRFSSPPDFVFSAVASKFYLFDDVDDKGDVNHESVKDIRIIDPHSFKWTRLNLTQLQDQHVVLMMNSTVPNMNGSFAIELQAFGSTKHGAELPHLYHSSHSMQIDLIAENINFVNYSSARVAVEFLAVSSENKSEGTFRLNKRRNLDDEFTPGIFDVYDIVSPRSDSDSRGAFFQYRPVCYTTVSRTVSGSTELKQGDIHSFNNNASDIDNKFSYTLPFSYYGYTIGSRIAQGSNITFGMHGDGFYSRSNYTSFSMLMGIGAPPVEKLSAFVIAFAVVGLGIPILVLLIGGTYVGIKRYNN